MYTCTDEGFFVLNRHPAVCGMIHTWIIPGLHCMVESRHRCPLKRPSLRFDVGKFRLVLRSQVLQQVAGITTVLDGFRAHQARRLIGIHAVLKIRPHCTAFSRRHYSSGFQFGHIGAQPTTPGGLCAAIYRRGGQSTLNERASSGDAVTQRLDGLGSRRDHTTLFEMHK